MHFWDYKRHADDYVGVLSALYMYILFIGVPVYAGVTFVGEPTVINNCWVVF
jgi:hypothetical protein